MTIKFRNLFLAAVLYSLPIFAQDPGHTLGWDLTYSSVLNNNKIDSKAWIRSWLASNSESPAKKWISEWKGAPIISSILIEYPAFHAAEQITMWLFRTKDQANYWQVIADTKFSDVKTELKTEGYDDLLKKITSWQQAKPASQDNLSVSIPGYIGFLSMYENGKSRQMLLSEEDFVACAPKKCKSGMPGRLTIALDPVIPKFRN